MDQLEQIFELHDTSGKGYLDKSELSLLCQNQQLSESEIDQLFHTLDSNQDGKIVKSEFMDNFATASGSPAQHGAAAYHHGVEDAMPMTSTPVRSMRHFAPNASSNTAAAYDWQDFTYTVGHTINNLFR